MIRCNACMTAFESEDELKNVRYGDIEFTGFKVCPNCNTDEYLMDFNPDIIITVRGGVVQAVHSSIEGITVHVNDHDNNENILDIGCNYDAIY